jgi:F-type H+-transporting ATPase subunit c
MLMLQSAKLIASGIAVSAISGAGIGIGNVFGSLINAVSRNPGLTNQLFSYAILGFALTEAIALFGLMMSFLLLFS